MSKLEGRDLQSLIQQGVDTSERQKERSYEDLRRDIERGRHDPSWDSSAAQAEVERREAEAEWEQRCHDAID